MKKKISGGFCFRKRSLSTLCSWKLTELELLIVLDRLLLLPSSRSVVLKVFCRKSEVNKKGKNKKLIL